MDRRRLAAQRPWLLALVAACVLFATVTQCDEFRLSISDPNSNAIPTDPFRPEPAVIAPAPSCVLPDIVTRLTNASPREWMTRSRQGEGSIPEGFTPTGVVRCETAQPDTGPATVDEVRLDGDIGAVARALSKPSLRARDEGTLDCAEIPYAPAGLWLTSRAGAIRVRWPTKPCGVQDDPLSALQALREVGRRTAIALAAPPVQPCDGDFTRELGRPTKPTDSTAKPVSRRPVVRLPERSLTATTICRHRLTGATTGPDAELVGTTRLSPAASTRLVRDAIAAPPAPPCDRPATEVIGAQLFRPDGSGGANLSIELDGCRRLSFPLFTTIRTAPPEVLRQLVVGG